MNFQYIHPVDTSKVILDIAFRKGRAKIGGGRNIDQKRKFTASKLDLVNSTISTRLKKILDDFPGTSVLPSFYQKLIKLTLDFSKFKKSLGALDWAIKQLNKLYKSYASRVSKAHDVNAFSTILKQFYGRVSSVMKQIKDNLAYLEQSRKIMKTYPDIKEMFTVCFYGFPNVGKTTLLNKFTGTKAKIAGYEFTTKSINAGYTIIDRKKIQVLDVPGTLARKETMNNIELMAELVLDEVADVVIYVFDFSGTGRMGEAKQRALFEKIKDKHKVIPYLAKTDLTPREKWSGFVKSKQELKKLIKSHL